jgi:hypothetical protein
MLPYSAVAIDYAAYQSRPHGMSSSTNNIGMPVGAAAAAAFTHSWFVTSNENEELFYADDNSNKYRYQKDIVDPGHVFLYFILFFLVVDNF